MSLIQKTELIFFFFFKWPHGIWKYNVQWSINLFFPVAKTILSLPLPKVYIGMGFFLASLFCCTCHFVYLGISTVLFQIARTFKFWKLFCLVLQGFFSWFWLPKYIYIYCHTHVMWKFPGQESNLCHSSDNTRSLTLWATMEPPPRIYFRISLSNSLIHRINV